MVKVALVNPRKSNINTSTAAPPLNLGYLASYLEKYHRDGKIVIIDGMAGHDIEKELLNLKPDIIGLTAATPEILETYRIADFARQNLKNALIVIGGVHASVLPEEGLEHADVVVVGEGEVALLEIVGKIDRKESIPKSILTKPYIQNLDSIPSPAWHLIDLEFYIKADDNTARRLPYTTVEARATSIMTSRGCPYRCIYCHNSWRMTPVRYHSAERVIAEMEYLNHQYKIDSIFFQDDEFMANGPRLFEICRLIKERGLNKKITWACCARSDVIIRTGIDNLRLIKEAGCNLVSIGFESGSQRVLDFLKNYSKIGRATVEQNRAAAILCKRAGLKVSCSLMFGAPTETEDDMLATLKFVEENKDFIDLIGVGITTPYPGTVLWRWCLEHNLIKSDIDYRFLCQDPRFGLADERIICDTMSKQEFRSLFAMIQDRTRELNLSKRIEGGYYSLTTLIHLFLSEPIYVLAFVLKHPKRAINLIRKAIRLWIRKNFLNF